MKAVILSAGEGKRLRPLTVECPKGMIQVGGMPIIERQIKLFRAYGIDDIVVVGGYKHDSIPDYGVKKYINEAYDTTNMVYTLFCADEALNDEVVVSYGDILYSGVVLRTLLEAQHDIAVIVDLDWYSYFSKRFDNVCEDAESLCMTDACEVINIGEKVDSLEKIQAQYIGLMKFSAEAIKHLRHIYFSALKDTANIGWGRPARIAYMTDLLQEVINRGHPVHGVPIRGGWCEIDTKRDLEIATQMLPAIEAPPCRTSAPD